jgi:hypothetical protein
MSSKTPDEAFFNLQMYKELSKELRMPEDVQQFLKRGG